MKDPLLWAGALSAAALALREVRLMMVEMRRWLRPTLENPVGGKSPRPKSRGFFFEAVQAARAPSERWPRWCARPQPSHGHPLRRLIGHFQSRRFGRSRIGTSVGSGSSPAQGTPCRQVAWYADMTGMETRSFPTVDFLYRVQPRGARR